MATKPIFENFWKKCIFPLKIPKHLEKFQLLLDMQNVMHIAPNAGHTAQNDGQTMRNVGRNTLNVYQGPKGGLRRAPGDPVPLYLKEL